MATESTVSSTEVTSVTAAEPVVLAQASGSSAVSDAVAAQAQANQFGVLSGATAGTKVVRGGSSIAVPPDVFNMSPGDKVVVPEGGTANITFPGDEKIGPVSGVLTGGTTATFNKIPTSGGEQVTVDVTSGDLLMSAPTTGDPNNSVFVKKAITTPGTSGIDSTALLAGLAGLALLAAAAGGGSDSPAPAATVAPTAPPTTSPPVTNPPSVVIINPDPTPAPTPVPTMAPTPAPTVAPPTNINTDNSQSGLLNLGDNPLSGLLSNSANGLLTGSANGLAGDALDNLLSGGVPGVNNLLSGGVPGSLNNVLGGGLLGGGSDVLDATNLLGGASGLLGSSGLGTGALTGALSNGLLGSGTGGLLGSGGLGGILNNGLLGPNDNVLGSLTNVASPLSALTSLNPLGQVTQLLPNGLKLV